MGYHYRMMYCMQVPRLQQFILSATLVQNGTADRASLCSTLDHVIRELHSSKNNSSSLLQ